MNIYMGERPAHRTGVRTGQMCTKNRRACRTDVPMLWKDLHMGGRRNLLARTYHHS